MSLVVPTVAELILLKYIINQQVPDDRLLHLYTNNYIPSESTTLQNLMEASVSGYNTVTLTGSNWVITQVAGVTTATYPDVVFNFNGAVTIVGYYITTLTNNLLWVEIFSNGPFSFPSNGGEMTVTPTITLD